MVAAVSKMQRMGIGRVQGERMGAVFRELCFTSASAYSGLTREVMISDGKSESLLESSVLLGSGGQGNSPGAG